MNTGNKTCLCLFLCYIVKVKFVCLFQPTKMEYTERDSYAALLHKTAFEGIADLIKSKEEIEQIRDVFENDLNHIEKKLVICLRRYFYKVRKSIKEVNLQLMCHLLLCGGGCLFE